MQTFVVISSLASHADLERAVRNAYTNAYHDVATNVWLVADRNVTAIDVSRRLGVQTGDVPGLDNVVVLQFANYWGHAPGAIWTWISEKMALD